jgi:hypothetical protein
MSKSLDFSYLNDKGKRVTGAAAFNHYVYTEKGSIQSYNDEVGTEYVSEFVRQNSDTINTGLAKKVKKSQLKVV